MDRKTSTIEFGFSDSTIDTILSAPCPDVQPVKKLYYNRNEDQFLTLTSPLEIPGLPVHHPLENRTPPDGYVSMIADLASFLMKEVPSLVAGTHWAFDPVNLHVPQFYRIHKIGAQNYLMLTRIDLACYPLDSEIIKEGSNNRTHAYRTSRLFFESDWMPLASVEELPDRTLVQPFQTIPNTWKGEAGQGYMIHGIWMDADINKFFSKLFLPEGRRSHPFYPVNCKHRCVCVNSLHLPDPEILERIREVIEPELDSILRDLQNSPFSELMPLFKRIRSEVPKETCTVWKNVRVTPTLDKDDHKEYIVEF